MLRHATDQRCVLWVFLYFLLTAVVWRMDWIASVIVLCYFSFAGACITHDSMHARTFTDENAEILWRHALSLTYGHPVSTFIPGHNLSHHRHTQTTMDPMRTTKLRYQWHWMNLLLFQPTVAWDVLVPCFNRILPWNDANVLNAVMTFDSKKLCTYEDVPEYEQNKVQQQLKAVRTLKMLKWVNRLFSEVARDVLLKFRKMFWGWIATNDLTVEGVHAGIIVFQKCTRTNELLCERMQYAGVSGTWSVTGWYADYVTQFEQTRALGHEISFEQARAKVDRHYGTLSGDIVPELLKRLLLSLRLHPRSRIIFTCCVRVLRQLHDDEEDILFQLWQDNPIVDLLEFEIKLAMKPNFKLMNPRLWYLGKQGSDIDSNPNKFRFSRQEAYTQLDQYIQRLCSTWDVLVLMGDKTISPHAQSHTISLLGNQKWLDSRHRQINWFSVDHHVILLLQLRQIMVKQVWVEYGFFE